MDLGLDVKGKGRVGIPNMGSVHIGVIVVSRRRDAFSARHTAIKKISQGFPGGAVVENLPANAGDTGSSPGLGRSHTPRSN